MLNWDDIEGQDVQKARLLAAVKEDRVASSYLFVGPEGVGKRAVAVGFAQQLNCEERAERPCGVCRSCRNIAAESHPDVRVVEPVGAARLVKIAQIRDVQKMLKSSPFEARYQVIIIDDADRMTTEASNALLKTLEEPPSRARIVLVSANPGSLLDTIVSRCQTMRFSRVPDRVVDKFVASIGTENSDRDLITTLAQGSPGQAKVLVDHKATETFRRAVDASLASSTKLPKSIVDMSADLTAEKSEVRFVLDAMRLLVTDLMALKSGEDVRIFVDISPRLAQRASTTSVRALERLWGEIELAQKRIERNSNARMTMERVLNAFAQSLNPESP